jgi:hypothetical protein
MITHRVETRVAPEPPVRFYRTIAITFLVITALLVGVVFLFSSKKAQIVIVAKNDNKNVNLTIDLGKDKGTSELSLPGLVTSTQFYYSVKYSPTGNKDIEGTAVGVATLYNKTDSDQALVKTTRLLTADGVLFRLADKVTVPANGQIDANVYADKAGKGSDIGPSKFTIPGLAEDKQKVIYAESAKAMTGGMSKVGVLTDDDIKAAEKDFVEKVKLAADSAISSTAGFDGRLLAVADNPGKADRKAGEEVSGFNVFGTTTVVFVYYKKDDLQNLLSKQVSGKIDVSSEKALSMTKDPQVSIANYDLAKETAQLAVYQDVLVTLDANADKLAVSNFFGKSKDEIERYVLGLGHVVGAEIKFSPSWIGKAPADADKIKVVVKNVQ